MFFDEKIIMIFAIIAGICACLTIPMPGINTITSCIFCGIFCWYLALTMVINPLGEAKDEMIDAVT